jgi:hypothetical protein
MNRRDIYFLNVPERGGRDWDEFRRLGYVSSVGCARTLDALSELTAGDRIAAYLRRCGYVGIGIVLGAACATPRADSNRLADEYRLPVRWLRAVERQHARWLPRRGLYASPQVMAPMAHRIETLHFLQAAFDLALTDEPRGARSKPRPPGRVNLWNLASMASCQT